MKYLGSITDDKDIATKEYVDKAVPPHMKTYPYTQTFTAPSTGYNWYYDIPYDSSYTVEQLLNFNAYYADSTNERYQNMSYFSVFKYTNSGTDYWRYYITFNGSPVPSGETLYVQNMFTDTDGTITLAGM